jgi:hypothetical protein
MLIWASNNNGGIVSTKTVDMAYVWGMFYFVLLGFVLYVYYELFLYKYRNLAVNRCQPLCNTLTSVQHCILFPLKNKYFT